MINLALYSQRRPHKVERATQAHQRSHPRHTLHTCVHAHKTRATGPHNKIDTTSTRAAQQPHLVDYGNSVAVLVCGLPEHVVEAGAVGVLLRAGVPLFDQLDRLLSRLARVAGQHCVDHLSKSIYTSSNEIKA